MPLTRTFARAKHAIMSLTLDWERPDATAMSQAYVNKIFRCGEDFNDIFLTNKVHFCRNLLYNYEIMENITMA